MANEPLYFLSTRSKTRLVGIDMGLEGGWDHLTGHTIQDRVRRGRG